MTRGQEDRRNSGCLEQPLRGKEEKFVVPNVERDISVPFYLTFNTQVAQKIKTL